MKELTKIDKLNRKRFEEDLLLGYNSIMSQLYKDYRMYSTDELRLMAMEIIVKHISAKTKLAMHRKQRLKKPSQTLPVECNKELEPTLESF